MKAAATRARNAKHAGGKKHASTSKHRPTATKKSPAAAHKAKVHVKHLSPKQAKARALSPGAVSCCSAIGLARSLRLAGWPVGADDVLALHWAASGGVDAGVSIWGVLAAAERSGLAGIRPVSFEPVDLEEVAPDGRGRLILGLDMPEGPHTVCLDPSGDVWSWGRRYGWDAFADCVVEEAWTVRWPSWL